MARLAADVDLGPSGLVRVSLRVVALHEAGGVTLGAHGVPVLGLARPVEPISGLDILVRVEVEPLSSLGVPSDGQALIASAWKRDQVLLQRAYAEHVGDLEVAHVSVGAFRVDEELPVASKEPGLVAVHRERGVIEIAQHGFCGGHVHGEIVV
jgi:hypothetical protein